MTVFELQTELTQQALMPPGGDTRIAAFCQAVLQMQTNPQLALMIEELLQRREDLGPSHIINLLLRTFQNHCMASDSTYPQRYWDEAAWTEYFKLLFDAPTQLAGIKLDLHQRQVQSNVVERYKAFKLVISLLQDRLGDSLSVLDVGCSRNHGLKKLKLNLPFRPISCAIPSHETFPAELFNRLLNGYLNRPLSLGECIGSDIVPLNRPGEAAWAKSCSFYPSEFLDQSRVSEYEYLDALELPGLSFETGDFSKYGLGPHDSARNFDVVTVSTFLYQLSTEERLHTRALLRNYVSQHGVIIYQDFARPTPDSSALHFEDSWFNSLFPYRTFVEFGGDGNGGLYELFRWDNGRCNRWAPGRHLSSLLR